MHAVSLLPNYFRIADQRTAMRQDEVQFAPAGPCALWHGQPGQVGNEAATAISCKCRRQGSPLSLFKHRKHRHSSWRKLPDHSSRQCHRFPVLSFRYRQFQVIFPPMVKPIVVVPFLLLAKVPPPCISAIALTIASPRPWPWMPLKSRRAVSTR